MDKIIGIGRSWESICLLVSAKDAELLMQILVRSKIFYGNQKKSYVEICTTVPELFVRDSVIEKQVLDFIQFFPEWGSTEIAKYSSNLFNELPIRKEGLEREEKDAN